MKLDNTKQLMQKSAKVLCIVCAGAAGLTLTALAFLYTFQAIGLILVLGLFLILLWRLRNA